MSKGALHSLSEMHPNTNAAWNRLWEKLLLGESKGRRVADVVGSNPGSDGHDDHGSLVESTGPPDPSESGKEGVPSP